MLKQDFNGYKDFIEKVMNTSGEESDKVCVDRIQMWSDKIMNVVNPLPGGDVPLVIVALKAITETLRKGDVKAGEIADRIERKIGVQYTTTTIEGDENTTEAAVRACAEALRKK